MPLLSHPTSNRFARLTVGLIALSVLTVDAGCGGGGSGVHPGTGACAVGQQIACPCQGGSMSIQVCGVDATYGPCQCGGGDGSMGSLDMSVAPFDMVTMMTPTDLSGADLARPMTVTAHDVATNVYPNNTMVSLDGLVVVGTAFARGPSKSGKCQYHAFLEDPTGAPPNALRLFLSSPCATDGGVCNGCPVPPNSGTVMDALTQLGDEFSVIGTVNTFGVLQTDAGPPHSDHELTPISLTRTAVGKMFPPFLIANSFDFAQGSGSYTTYENMLVRIENNGQAVQVKYTTPPDFHGTGASFFGTYSSSYSPNGPQFPLNNSAWRTIIGVVDPDSGGGVSPRIKADFVP